MRGAGGVCAAGGAAQAGSDGVTIRGVRYASVTAAAAAFGVSRATIRKHRRRGTLDRVGLPFVPQAMPVRIRGEIFADCASAGRRFGLTASAVYARLARGEADLIGLPTRRGANNARAVQIGPLRFASLAEASRVLGLSLHVLRRGLSGQSLDARSRMLAAAMRVVTASVDRRAA